MVRANDTILIKELYQRLDTNKNGKLSHSEIFAGFSKLYGPSCAKFECERIFTAAKVSKDDGEINLD